jgi:hypothetical protein
MPQGVQLHHAKRREHAIPPVNKLPVSAMTQEQAVWAGLSTNPVRTPRIRETPLVRTYFLSWALKVEMWVL